jgi:hypothetical protein
MAVVAGQQAEDGVDGLRELDEVPMRVDEEQP